MVIIKNDYYEIRDPTKRFAAHSPSLKNSKEKIPSSTPRVLYVDSSSTSRYFLLLLLIIISLLTFIVIRLMVKQTLQNDGILCDAVPSFKEFVISLINPPTATHVNNLKLPYDIVLVEAGIMCGGVCLFCFSLTHF